jgi:cytoskeletal protein CcmA (bactofilin family)
MAKKPDMFGVSGTDTVIGSSVKLKGNLTSEGDISLDGRMAGNVKSGGHVTVGVNAHITGDVAAVSVAVAGRLDGNIKVVDETHIMESGQVYGDVDTGRIQIGLGGILLGAIKMKKPEATELLDRDSIGEGRRS